MVTIIVFLHWPHPRWAKGLAARVTDRQANVFWVACLLFVDYVILSFYWITQIPASLHTPIWLMLVLKYTPLLHCLCLYKTSLTEDPTKKVMATSNKQASSAGESSSSASTAISRLLAMWSASMLHSTKPHYASKIYIYIYYIYYHMLSSNWLHHSQEAANWLRSSFYTTSFSLATLAALSRITKTLLESVPFRILFNSLKILPSSSDLPYYHWWAPQWPIFVFCQRLLQRKLRQGDPCVFAFVGPILSETARNKTFVHMGVLQQNFRNDPVGSSGTIVQQSRHHKHDVSV